MSVELYAEVAISGVLTDSQYGTLRDFDLTTATHSSGTVTAGSETISVTSIKEDVVGFTPTITDEAIDRTSIADEARVMAQGRQSSEFRMLCFPNYATNATFDQVIKDTEGVRLLYVERSSSKQMIALVVATTATDPFDATEDRQVYEITFQNAGSKRVHWV